jgi:hypothetical protein
MNQLNIKTNIKNNEIVSKIIILISEMKTNKSAPKIKNIVLDSDDNLFWRNNFEWKGIDLFKEIELRNLISELFFSNEKVSIEEMADFLKELKRFLEN